MPDQSDYGTKDNPELVPDSLIAYRHFTMHPDVALAPVAYPKSGVYASSGVWTADCQKKRQYSSLPAQFALQQRTQFAVYGGYGWHYDSVRVPVPGPACGGCACSECEEGVERAIRDYAAAYEEHHGAGHQSPVLDCSCGFYAHYYPNTDFYAGSTWGPKAQTDFDAIYGTHKSSPLVRAVVEVTGRTVMGSRGVRAQKMRIKALAIDWAKYRSGANPYLSNGTNWFYWDQAQTDRAYAEANAPSVDTIGLFTELAVKTAQAYEAEFFADPAEMYAAYPKPDLSALGIEAKPEPVPFEDSVYYSGAGAQVAYSTSTNLTYTPQPLTPAQLQGIAGLKPASMTVSGCFSGIVDEAALFGSSKPPTLDEPAPLTPFERVMQAKKSKPAPPGTGIDWRRKKP